MPTRSASRQASAQAHAAYPVSSNSLLDSGTPIPTVAGSWHEGPPGSFRGARRPSATDRACTSITLRLYNRMITSNPQAAHVLDATFSALADPTRRAILARLATGEASVTELAEPFEISQPAISKHLKVLERAGLVSVDQDGARRLRRLKTAPLEAASEWIARYRDMWESQFRRLDKVLDELKVARQSE